MEIWKPIEGFDGYYEVSNYGNVRSICRTVIHQKGSQTVLCDLPERNMKNHENSSGYMRVHLSKDGKKQWVFVHRLVAEHFVENSNPDEFDTVNHLDCNPKNNHYKNLEWTTQSGNMKYASCLGRLKCSDYTIQRTKEVNSFPIIGESILTGEIKKYASISDCAKDGFTPSAVCLCCKGRRRKHKSFTWRYAEVADYEK